MLHPKALYDKMPRIPVMLFRDDEDIYQPRLSNEDLTQLGLSHRSPTCEQRSEQEFWDPTSID